MAKVRVKWNPRGYREYNSSASVQAFLNQLVISGAAAANSMEGTPRTDRGEVHGFTAWTPGPGGGRGRARIYATGPTARRRNAQNNTLLKALGSAR